LVDVMLPDGNGIEICTDLKNDMFTKHIPVIVMSANPRSKELSTQASADDYISKPFDVDDVVKRIDQLLDKKGTKANPGSTANEIA
jgi:two-component system phosphate regulon response regulator PhoB